MNEANKSIGERDLAMAIGVLGLVALLAIIVEIIS
jgi:hypothetical protein